MRMCCEPKTKKQLLQGEENVVKARMDGRSTIQIFYADGTRVVKYHDAHVLTYRPNGDIVLNSGGYRTQTTKERMSRDGIHISQCEGVWYVSIWDGEKSKSLGEFYDGMAIDSQGNLINGKKVSDHNKIHEMKRKISEYVNRIGTKEVGIPRPSAGDCWFCAMVCRDNGKPLGDALADTDHLLSHMEERYYPGSLLFNAMVEDGISDKLIAMAWHLELDYTFKRALRRYLTRRLLPDIAPV